MASALLAVCDDYFRGQAILSAPIEKGIEEYGTVPRFGHQQPGLCETFVFSSTLEFGRIVAHQEECLIKLKDLQRENSELRVSPLSCILPVFH